MLRHRARPQSDASAGCDCVTDNPLPYVQWFRGASPYINAHRDRTMVLMLGGDALAHENFDNVIHDVALLASLDVRLVLVFGARPQIDSALALGSLAFILGFIGTVLGGVALTRIKRASGGKYSGNIV